MRTHIEPVPLGGQGGYANSITGGNDQPESLQSRYLRWYCTEMKKERVWNRVWGSIIFAVLLGIPVGILVYLALYGGQW
jgi:hypothetical protein